MDTGFILLIILVPGMAICYIIARFAVGLLRRFDLLRSHTIDPEPVSFMCDDCGKPQRAREGLFIDGVGHYVCRDCYSDFVATDEADDFERVNIESDGDIWPGVTRPNRIFRVPPREADAESVKPEPKELT